MPYQVKIIGYLGGDPGLTSHLQSPGYCKSWTRQAGRPESFAKLESSRRWWVHASLEVHSMWKYVYSCIHVHVHMHMHIHIQMHIHLYLHLHTRRPGLRTQFRAVLHSRRRTSGRGTNASSREMHATASRPSAQQLCKERTMGKMLATPKSPRWQAY